MTCNATGLSRNQTALVVPCCSHQEKNGELCFCIDYSKLNEVTKTVFHCLGLTKRWLEPNGSPLYVKSRYLQVDVHLDALEKTAFSTGQGLWQFTVKPFGHCNALATFERLMETVLRGLTYDSRIVYLDDVIVIGHMFKEHLLNSWKVFQWFCESHLKLNPEKCQLLHKEVRYLGHIVSPKRISTDPEKLKAMQEWRTPKNKLEIRSFVGLCTYYRRFISSFANIAKLLTRLTEQKQTFQWTPEMDAAFQTLKGALCAAPILVYPSQERGSLWTQTPVKSNWRSALPSTGWTGACNSLLQ
jgi:hypothetical protein